MNLPHCLLSEFLSYKTARNIYLSNEYLLDIYYVSGSTLHARVTLVNKTNSSCPLGADNE